MPNGQLDIPALPILVPLGLLLMAASWLILRRRDRLSRWRLAAWWASGWYVVAVAGATLLPLHLSWGPASGPPELFRIIVVPITTMRPDDFVLNIAMTLPIALVLRVVAGITDRHRVVLTGFLLSLGIEVFQGALLLLHGNRWADVNDLAANTAGAVLGWLALRRALEFPAVRALVDRCSAPVEPNRERARQSA